MYLIYSTTLVSTNLGNYHNNKNPIFLFIGLIGNSWSKFNVYLCPSECRSCQSQFPIFHWSKKRKKSFSVWLNKYYWFEFFDYYQILWSNKWILFGVKICKEVFLSFYSYNQSITCRQSKLKYSQKIQYPLLTDETAKINS